MGRPLKRSQPVSERARQSGTCISWKGKAEKSRETFYAESGESRSHRPHCGKRAQTTITDVTTLFTGWRDTSRGRPTPSSTRTDVKRYRLPACKGMGCARLWSLCAQRPPRLTCCCCLAPGEDGAAQFPDNEERASCTKGWQGGTGWGAGGLDLDGVRRRTAWSASARGICVLHGNAL